jgi:hypothetical protein
MISTNEAANVACRADNLIMAFDLALHAADASEFCILVIFLPRPISAGLRHVQTCSTSS